ncbi:MAG: AN1-type zinc finger protein, partial [Promethearchaeota archaeon]
MPRCYLCFEEKPEVYTCEGCGKSYCSLHKNPSDHNCNIFKEEALHRPYQPVIENETFLGSDVRYHQVQQYQTTTSSNVVRGTTDGTYTWYRQEKSIPEDAFSPGSGINFKGILLPYKSEFIHLVVGCALIFIVGLIAFYDEQLLN